MKRIIKIVVTVLVLMLVIYNRRRDSVDKKDMESDVRENIIKYDDDGGGLEDMTAVTLTVSGLGHTMELDAGITTATLITLTRLFSA